MVTVVNDIELEITPGGQRGEYQVRVIRAASGGEPHGTLHLDVPRILGRRPTLENAVLASAAHARGGPVPEVERPLREAGQELFEGLFSGPVRETYRASVAVARERGSKLRVVLHLDAAELAALPWEAMWDPEAHAYLCRKEPLVRHVASPYTPEPLPVTPPLRVLCLVASPRGLPELDVTRERQHLDEALAAATADGRIHLDWLGDATWDALQDRLLTGTWHVLHFIGHGDYDPVLDQGRVALVREEDGRADWVEAGRLVDLLNEADPTPRLVVLNSCSSGQSGTQDVLSGTAAALVNGGISAVAAMQFRISDPAAVAFPRGFYKALAAGKTVDAALSSGRIAILGLGESLEWVTPVLYTRGGASRLFALEPSTAPASEADTTPSVPGPVRSPVPLVGTGGTREAPSTEPAEAVPAEVTDDPRYQRAQDAYRRGDWDQAVTLLELIHTEHPQADIPELAKARGKLELASWWTQRETKVTATPRPPAAPRGPARVPVNGPGAPASEHTGPGPTPATSTGGSSAHGGPPPPLPTPGAPGGQGPRPTPPGPPQHRRRSVVIAVLVLIVCISGFGLLRPGGQGDIGTSPTTAPTPVSTSTPSQGATPEKAAAPNLAAFTLSSEDAIVELDKEGAFEVRVWNKPSTSRRIGPASGGDMTVTVEGPQIAITNGEPLGAPASGCQELATPSASMTCTFDRLDPDATARFRITLRGLQVGDVQVKTSAAAEGGTSNPPIPRTFTVEHRGGDCVVPDVTSQSREQAETEIAAHELNFSAEGVEDGMASGMVIGQDPLAGTHVPCGSTVTFKYSTIL